MEIAQSLDVGETVFDKIQVGREAVAIMEMVKEL